MARIANFFDGAESETTPTIGNIVASALVQYPDDATYEANEQNAPATGNLYYNTTDNVIRYYNGSQWITIVDESTSQTLTNKTIDADSNTITNIDNDEIKANAAIDVTKLHDGSVDNTEFGYLDGVTSNIQTQLNGKQDTSEKGQPNGYASLDGSGLVPSTQLPSYVDDVLEFADFASFPVTGETGKIYIALDTNLTYRWTGSVYVQISSGIDDLSDLIDVNTDGVADRDQLIYNSGAGEWQPSRATLGELDGVDLTTTPPVAGNALVYDGTDWVPGEGGGSGVGGISYVKNPDAETDTADHTIYDDGPVLEPVDGIGGTPTILGLTRSTDPNNLLRGEAVFLMNKTTSDARGEGIHVGLDPIDPRDRNSRLQVSFDYKHPLPGTNGFAQGDVVVFVYDVDNAELIGRVQNDDNGEVLRHEGDGATFIGWFDSTDSLNYRLLFHIPTTSTLEWDMAYDNVKVGPNSFVPVQTQYSQDIDLTGNGGFTGGLIRVSRVGNNVTITTLNQLTFASANTVNTTTNTLPTWAAPTDSIFNITNNEPASTIKMGALADRALTLRFRDWTGAFTNRTSIENLTMSYNVAGLTNVVSNTELSQQTSIVRVTGLVGQTIPTGVSTKVDLTAIETKKGSGLSIDLVNNNIVCNKSGEYSIFGQGALLNLGPGDLCFVEIKKNDITRLAAINISAGDGGSDDPLGCCGTTVSLLAGDTVQLYIFHNFGSNRTTFDTILSMHSLPDFTNYGVIGEKNKVQTKILSANVTAPGTMADLTFNGLQIGKWYEIGAQFYVALDDAISSTLIQIIALHDGNIIGRNTFQISESTDLANDNVVMTMITKFQATTTTLTFDALNTSTGSVIIGTGLQNGSFVQLEERNDLIETGEFS